MTAERSGCAGGVNGKLHKKRGTEKLKLRLRLKLRKIKRYQIRKKIKLYQLSLNRKLYPHLPHLSQLQSQPQSQKSTHPLSQQKLQSLNQRRLKM